MTTKKQRREQVAARRAAYDAETKRLGEEALKREREKRERIAYDAKRAEHKKATALKMRKQHEAAAAKEEIPENLRESVSFLDELNYQAEDLRQRMFEELSPARVDNQV